MSALQNWKIEYERLEGDKPKKLRRTIGTRLVTSVKRVTTRINTKPRKMGGGNR